METIDVNFYVRHVPVINSSACRNLDQMEYMDQTY